jgi:hypothetical protein
VSTLANPEIVDDIRCQVQSDKRSAARRHRTRRTACVASSAADHHRPARHEPQVYSQPRRLIERVRALVEQAATPHILRGNGLWWLPQQLGRDLDPVGDPCFDLRTQEMIN